MTRIRVPRSGKGLLLTLLVIILFILMLAEVITYVVINSNYDQLTAYGTQATQQAFSGYTFASGMGSFMQISLAQALKVLVVYEAPGGYRAVHPINNTAYFLESLMNNGSVYGVSFAGQMGQATISSYVDAFLRQEALQQMLVNISNESLTVYQGTPLTVNTTFRALITSSTVAGKFSYPVSVTASVPLNGTADLYSDMAGSPVLMSIQPSPPAAAELGGVNAIRSSTSPFMFTYGTLIYMPGTPTCSGIPGKFRNGNFILVTPNAGSLNALVCNMGGLVTNNIGSLAPNVPYLVYNGVSGNALITAIQGIYNDTAALLSGPSKALFNISQIQAGAGGYQYYPAQYGTPYLSEPQSVSGWSPTVQAGEGLFSFLQANYAPPYFNGVNSLVTITNSLTVNNVYTLSLWFESPKSYLSSFNSVLLSSSQPSANGMMINLCGVGNCLGSNLGGLQILPGNDMQANVPISYAFDFASNTWYNVAVVASSNSVSMYLDGALVANSINEPYWSVLSNTVHQLQLGNWNSPTNWFNGQMADLQIYNSALPPESIQALYESDPAATPVNTRNSIVWLPLNNNVNDSSGNGYNAIANNIGYMQIGGGALLDPITMKTLQLQSENNAGILEVLNCQNANQCSNLALPHIDVSGAFLGNAIANESNTLGMGEAALPKALSFTNGGYAITAANIPWLMQATSNLTFSVWVYPTQPSGVILNQLQNGAGTAWLSMVSGTLDIYAFGEICVSLGTIPTNSWSNIVLSYSSRSGSSPYVVNAYVNGAETFTTTSGSEHVLTYAPQYSLGQQNTNLNCGVSAAFNGFMSDFQIYNSMLSNGNALSLYENDSIVGLSANDMWRLRVPFNGLYNQTAELSGNVLGNVPLVFNYPAGTCSSANALKNTCGIGFALP